MSSSYRGVYVQRDSQGNVWSVQVVDIGGVSIPLPPHEYIDKKCNPPIHELPDESVYHSSIGKAQPEFNQGKNYGIE